MASNAEVENQVDMVNSNLDDDDDLEALRLAALLSRKSAHEAEKNQGAIDVKKENSCINLNQKTFPNRNHRNNFVSTKWGRPRSSNLIVINPMPEEEPRSKSEAMPKLIFPQDKWCPQASDTAVKSTESSGPGKFSRIRYQSDDSDMDNDSEEEEDNKSEQSDSSVSDELIADIEDETLSDSPVTQSSVDDVDGEKGKRLIVPNSSTNTTTDSKSDSSDGDENVENLLEKRLCSDKERTRFRIGFERTSPTRKAKSKEESVPSKKLVDLREVLKAKRDIKNNSDDDSDDSTSGNVRSSIKSVLSVVKCSPKRNNLPVKARSQETRSREQATSRSVFLSLDPPHNGHNVNTDGMQVTVVTGSNDVEKKCSVHMRLGQKVSSPSKSKVPITSRLGVVKHSDDEEPSTRDKTSVKEKNRKGKRSQRSGYRDSKESERSTKICRTEKINSVRR